MLNEPVFDKDLLVEWCRQAKEECKTPHWCPQCGILVELILRDHKHYQNFYACKRCGELLFTKITFAALANRGYKPNRLTKKI